MLLCNAATGNLVHSWRVPAGAADGRSWSCLAVSLSPGSSSIKSQRPQLPQQLIAVASPTHCAVLTAPWSSQPDNAAVHAESCSLVSSYVSPQVWDSMILLMTCIMLLLLASYGHKSSP